MDEQGKGGFTTASADQFARPNGEVLAPSFGENTSYKTDVSGSLDHINTASLGSDSGFTPLGSASGGAAQDPCDMDDCLPQGGMKNVM